MDVANQELLKPLHDQYNKAVVKGKGRAHNLHTGRWNRKIILPNARYTYDDYRDKEQEVE